jgi:(2Fe-2S) ferredoxin
MPKPERHVFVCVQNRPAGHPRGSCSQRNSGDLLNEFAGQFESKGLFGRFGLTSTGCLGPCDKGPNILIYPDGVMYSGVQAADVAEIVDEHLVGGKPVERLLTDPEIWS